MLWSYDEFESAVDFIENSYNKRQEYLNTTHSGIFERMKQHTSIKDMSFGERLVKGVLDEENYEYKQECYIGHSLDDIHSQSIRLDFVVFYKNVLHVIEYNGAQHYRSVEKFGGQERFAVQQENDRKKKEFCERYNIPLLEIPYTVNSKDNVRELIVNFIGKAETLN
jgi:hypothetical protein